MTNHTRAARLELIDKVIDQMKELKSDAITEDCPIGIVSMENWEWPQGVGLFSLYQYYKETGRKDILEYLRQWFDKHIANGLPEKNINTMCPMLTLTYLYEELKDERYLELCREWVFYAMNEQPRTGEGGFQHTVSGYLNEGQLWDDTLYMTVLFVARMGQLLQDDAYIQESIRQFLVHLKYLTDPVTGLFFHGWTFIGHHHYARALWGRGNCWYTAGLVDYLDMADIPEGVRLFLLSSLERQVRKLAELQSASGMWHTLLDDPDSYEETSATAGFAYGILKAVRKGMLDRSYKPMALKALDAIVQQIDGKGVVGGVSYGTAVGSALQSYKDVPQRPMAYGQSMVLLALVESLKHDSESRINLNAHAPEIVRELGSETVDGVAVRRVVFHSRKFAGMNEEVYAVIARPAAEGEYPGILYLHGGAGCADEQTAVDWAKRGYIALTLDQPGIAEPGKCPHSAGGWKGLPYGANRFTAQSDISASTIFSAVTAGLNAFWLLLSQPGIIRDRIGITGISWGGYLTTMLSGLLGDQVRAAYSVFGSGYFDKGTVFGEELNRMVPEDRRIWLEQLDAGRRASGIAASYFVAAAVKDHFFWPPAVNATLQNIHSGKNQAFAPAVSHELDGLPGGDTSPVFFGYYLKGQGEPFPVVQVESVSAKPDGGRSIIAKVEASTSIQSVKLYYSLPNAEWEARVWEEADAVWIGDNRYEALLPADRAAAGADYWYVNASDSRPVTAGTPVHPIPF